MHLVFTRKNEPVISDVGHCVNIFEKFLFADGKVQKRNFFEGFNQEGFESVIYDDGHCVNNFEKFLFTDRKIQREKILRITYLGSLQAGSVMVIVLIF